MKPENELFLKTNRHHLDSINRTGTVKNIQLERMRQVMLEEFNAGYGPIDDTNVDQVFKLIRDVYTFYDELGAKKK